MIETELFARWPYDQALSWMINTQSRVERDPHLVVVGVGSHQEPVITLGKNPLTSIIHQEKLSKRPEVIIRAIERGGGATVHEPGQIVLYPILNIKFHGLLVKDLACLLERTMINFLTRFGLSGVRGEGSPGIFIGREKIGFIGLRIKQDISSHGMALNVLNDGHLFGAIDPCGISGLKVTSLYRHAGVGADIGPLLGFMGEDFRSNFLTLSVANNGIAKTL
jgi:lipoate-protein ligase B